jgi:predicted permease
MDLVDALAPVVLLIALGHALRRTGFMPKPAWAPLERLVYYVFFPAFLFVELARASLVGLPLVAVTVTLLGALLAMTAVAVLISRTLRLPGPTYTSVLQGLIRWNSYVALVMVPPLFGREALPLGALAIALLVPAANVVSVAALARHGSGSGGLCAVPRALLTNPLMVGCAAGIAWNLAGPALPTLLAEPLGLLSRATLALGLLSVGAALEPAAVTRRPGLLLLVAVGKLLVMPLTAWGLGRLLRLSGAPLGVVVLAVGAPTATASYILARLLGGDAELIAAIVAATTLGALVTLPLILSLPF